MILKSSPNSYRFYKSGLAAHLKINHLCWQCLQVFPNLKNLINLNVKLQAESFGLWEEHIQLQGTQSRPCLWHEEFTEKTQKWNCSEISSVTHPWVITKVSAFLYCLSKYFFSVETSLPFKIKCIDSHKWKRCENKRKFPARYTRQHQKK